MKTPIPNPPAPAQGRIEELDDTTLRSGHALLDDHRAGSFSVWMDHQLDRLETRFRQCMTHQSVRKSLGR